MMPLPETPEIRRLLEEARALSAVLACVDLDHRCPHEDALALVSASLKAHQGTSIEASVTKAAMQHILQEEVTGADWEPAKAPLDRLIFETTARAWMVWVTGGYREQGHELLRNLSVPRNSQGERGALALMALQPWTVAVSALLRENLDEARRQFDRATELSAQFGTDTNTVIQWTYAASFWVISEGTP